MSLIQTRNRLDTRETTEAELTRSVDQNVGDTSALLNALNLKADNSTTYTKTEVDNNLALKADKATTYTNTEIDTSLDTKQM